MALATYSDLKTEALRIMRRTGVTFDENSVADWVTLAEAKLNRRIDPVEVESTLACVESDRTVDISALSMKEPVTLFLADPSTGDEIELTPKAKGTYPFSDDNARPRYWSVDDDDIIFDCPSDDTYSLRFVYRQRFALSDSATTNWLLTNHSDVYLAAVLMWGAGYHEEWEKGATWKGMLDEGIPEVKSQITAKKRAVLTVDPALQLIGRRQRLTDWNDL